MYKFKFKLNLIRHPQNLHNQSACIREGGGQADGRLRGPKTNREIEYVWRNLLGYVAVVDSLYQIYIWLSRAEHTDDVVVAVRMVVGIEIWGWVGPGQGQGQAGQ